ncbi:hypothetical protein V8E52_011776 [Russula decolorans]
MYAFPRFLQQFTKRSLLHALQRDPKHKESFNVATLGNLDLDLNTWEYLNDRTRTTHPTRPSGAIASKVQGMKAPGRGETFQVQEPPKLQAVNTDYGSRTTELPFPQHLTTPKFHYHYVIKTLRCNSSEDENAAAGTCTVQGDKRRWIAENTSVLNKLLYRRAQLLPHSAAGWRKDISIESEPPRAVELLRDIQLAKMKYLSKSAVSNWHRPYHGDACATKHREYNEDEVEGHLRGARGSTALVWQSQRNLKNLEGVKTR